MRSTHRVIRRLMAVTCVTVFCAVAQDDFPDLWQTGDVGVLSPPGTTTYDASTGAFTLTAWGVA